MALTITHTHIMGRKPLARDYVANQKDAGPLSDAHELKWEEFVLLTTAKENLGKPFGDEMQLTCWRSSRCLRC